MKIETLDFKISDCYGLYETDNCGRKDWESIYSNEEIDSIVNKRLAELEVISIDIKYFTLDRHNNGRNDTIIERITIIYK